MDDMMQGKVTVDVRSHNLSSPYVGLIVIGQTNQGEPRAFKTVLQNIEGRLTTMGHFGQAHGLNDANFVGVFRHCQFDTKQNNSKAKAPISAAEREHRHDWEWNNAAIVVDTRRASATMGAIDVNQLMRVVAIETRHGVTVQGFVDCIAEKTDAPVQVGQKIRQQRQAVVNEIVGLYRPNDIRRQLAPDQKNQWHSFSRSVLGKRSPEGDTMPRRYEAGECIKAVLMQNIGSEDEILNTIRKGLEDCEIVPVVVPVEDSN